MNKRIKFRLLLVWGILLIPICTIIGQSSDYEMKGNNDEVEADFLLSYYQQDGDNSPVTGGIGTESLQDAALIFNVNIPLDSTKSINVYLGADAYSSASTDMIDGQNNSSASSQDVRAYGTVSYAQKNLKRGETYGIRLGFSAEYDYTSFSGGLSYAKEFNEGNSEISLVGQAFIDQWSLIYPVELRRTVSLLSNKRQSYNLQATYSQVINQRMQLSLSAELIYMKGLLSTPFHRVYFSDQSSPDIERLPDTRLKIPIGVRFNYFPTDNLVLRSYYRFYTDDFGIQAHTLSLEAPIKLSEAFTIFPFYRYHTQNASDYFAPYQQHLSTETFYTSDYDLAALQSHKIGFGVRYAPLYGVGRTKFFKKALSIKDIHFRGAYYTRDTDLNAFIFSMGISLGIK